MHELDAMRDSTDQEVEQCKALWKGTIARPDCLDFRRALHMTDDKDLFIEKDAPGLLLSLAASWDDFAELAPLFHVQPRDVPQTAKAQDTLRAQNDKLVARLYGITDAELADLLRSFKVMAGKCPEYLTLLAQGLGNP